MLPRPAYNPEEPVDTEKLVATRRTLHALAEHLLAGDLARRTGKIGLRVTAGGFGQPEIVAAGERRRIRIDGTDLVVLTGDRECWKPLTTAAELAAFAAAELGAPTGTYQPETTLDPEATLDVDDACVEALARWFDLVDRALEEVRRHHRAAEPTLVQVWPEHFDVACTISEVNLGGSPGDDDHPEPYLYVGPWTPRTGEFWNEPWGASVPWRTIPAVADAVTFLEDGLRRATGAP
jgi:hypothetical protein